MAPQNRGCPARAPIFFSPWWLIPDDEDEGQVSGLGDALEPWSLCCECIYRARANGYVSLLTV
jgi:hypothetical protein